MEEKGSDIKRQAEKTENLKYEVAQEMGLESKDEIDPPDD
jgi:hypothetical protein